MKKIIFLAIILVPLFLSSCFEWDNYDEPDCAITGTFTDVYTGQPLLASQNEWQIHAWERSWWGIEGGATQVVDLRIKQDGTYRNTKLFAGRYDITPDRAPFWPVATESVELKSGATTTLNWDVHPYFQIENFEIVQGTHDFGTFVPTGVQPSIVLRCRVRAPRRDAQDGTDFGMQYVMAFISHNQFCGNGTNGRIDVAQYNGSNRTIGGVNTPMVEGETGRITVNRAWDVEMADRFDLPAGSELSGVYEIGPLPVKSGYTYQVRIGANSLFAGNRYNYSDIRTVVVP